MITMDILDILKKYFGEDYRLKQDDILKYLQTDYMIEIDRRAVVDNLNSLLKKMNVILITRKQKEKLEKTKIPFVLTFILRKC